MLVVHRLTSCLRLAFPLLFPGVALASTTVGPPSTVGQQHGPRHAPAAAPIGSVGAPRFTVTDLGTLAGTDSATSGGLGLNRFGHVAGYAEIDSGPDGNRAVVFRDGMLFSLLPGVPAAAWDVNDQGVVALEIGPFAALLRGDSYRLLPTLGGDTEPHALNELGDCVGSSRSTLSVVRPTLWRNGAVHDLGTLVPGVLGVALDINDAGLIAGTSEDASGVLRPVKWEASQIVTLRSLAGPDAIGIARGVNRHGDIVGSSDLPVGSGRRVATIWWADGRVRGLRPLEEGGTGFALDINDGGWVIGLSSGPQTSISRPFLWTGDRPLDLNSLIDPQGGWNLGWAHSINNRGQIAGVGFCPCGAMRGFLLTPEG